MIPPATIEPLALGDDPWSLRIVGVDPAATGQHETIFALSNGFLGVRGSWEQGSPVYEPGTLVNGFHEVWPIEYPEIGFGYATTGQTTVYVPDATGLGVYVNGTPLDLALAEVVRVLDLRRGVLVTNARWPEVTVSWQRLVSLQRRNILAGKVEVTAHQGVTIEIYSIWRNRQDTDYLAQPEAEFDPRRAPAFKHPVLVEKDFDRSSDGLSFEVGYRTATSGMELTCRCEHRPDEELAVLTRGTQTTFKADLEAGQTIRLEKISAFELGRSPDTSPTFVELANAQARHLEAFWSRFQIVIAGDPKLQQAVNWIVFQLHQASALVDNAGLPAKGLTSQAYEGHYFWDMDVFMLPFVVHTDPATAASLIRFRHSMLPKARHRARQLNLAGALFPWRTINGEEASAYYEAGTAQYHINAAVIHGMTTYLDATGDDSLLWECGVEMAIETARMWVDLGFLADTGKFHIHMVTGPDEYSAMVDDNAYTNLMARASLLRAVRWTERMAAEWPDRYRRLAGQLELRDEELDSWRQAAAAMHIPLDLERGITPQDARFLEREHWDWTTPADRYPLLLNYHPLVIYRYQVLKQADVVMAILNLPDDFSPELAVANFHYYDPLTTADSSLSSPVQAAVAARIGEEGLALDYFRRAAMVDLADLADNAANGVHLAAAGGVWLALVGGFGGFRLRDGEIVVEPAVPRAWGELSFSVLVRGSLLAVTATPDDMTLAVTEGAPLRVEAWGQSIKVGPDPVIVSRN